MRIAVLGANGFVGSSIFKYFSKDNFVIPFTRNNINMLDPVQVANSLKGSNYDVIINCASHTSGISSFNDVRNDLGLFMNFYNSSDLFGKFINISSGAEFDRARDLFNTKEVELFDRLPSDSYGFSQNVKSRLCSEKDNFYNLRIFNCFGNGEISTRIFPRYLARSGSLEITNDRYFDYFCIQDLCTVVKEFAINNQLVKDVNCVYKEKFKISQVLEKFCQVNNLPSEFNVTSNSSTNYTGSGELLDSLKFDLIGLENGLASYMKDL
jgi:GDP-L-fucose synthase